MRRLNGAPRGETVDRSRRALLRGRAGTPVTVRRPPWAAEGFESACTRCGDCIDACPQGILTIGDGGYPEVDFDRGQGECTFCHACVDACPEPAFDSRRQPAWTLEAALGDACLARQGVHCQSCAEICAWQAIRFVLVRGAPPQPVIDGDACTGCGACQSVCPANAITVAPAESHHA